MTVEGAECLRIPTDGEGRPLRVTRRGPLPPSDNGIPRPFCTPRTLYENQRPMHTFHCAILMLLTAALSTATMAKEAEETFGCEANPTGDPIGGGDGYRDILTRGDFTVSTKGDLLAALKQAKPGQVVFVPHGVEIELTGATGIQLPGGVTLAGTRGLNGSPGARLFTQQRSGTQLVTTGDRARATGLRFEGPFAGVDKTAKNATFLMTRHFRTEIDNCEIYNWNIQGVHTALGASQVQVHHNYIHHCQRSGYGYGVVVYCSDVHIIANKFDYCRHHVAAGGRPGCSYEAAWNLIMPHCTSTCLDMHGGRDRGDSTDIAGDWMNIHHNTFQGRQRAVGIRGTPSQGADVHHNWFSQSTDKAVSSAGNTRVFKNVYGPDRTPQEKRIEF